MKIHIITMIAAASLLAGCTKSGVESASKEFNNLPVAVQKSVHATAPNAEVADVDEDKRDGLTVYKIKFQDPDRHPAIWLAPDGTVLQQDVARGGTTETVTVNRGSATGNQAEFSALPVPVQKAIQDNAPRAEVSGIKRAEENGRIYYTIEYAGKNKNPSIQIAEDGTITRPLSRETKDATPPRY